MVISLSAFGKFCTKCSKRNHFVVLCSTNITRVRNISEEYDGENEILDDIEETI